MCPEHENRLPIQFIIGIVTKFVIELVTWLKLQTIWWILYIKRNIMYVHILLD